MHFKISNRRLILSCLFALIAVFSVVFKVEAATLYLSPASGNFTIGETFGVNVVVSSSDQALNAVQGTVVFPTNLLSVASVSKAGSVINLWVQDPSYDNSAGQVNFAGVVLNPGFIGSGARVLHIVFEAKATGLASVSLTSASVLANDGQATSILSQLGGGKYLIGPAMATPSIPSPEVNFIITSLDGPETTNPQPRFQFEVTNLNKPIDHYDVGIDQGDFVTWNDDGSHIYTAPVLNLGKHTLTVKAFYASNRFLIATASIEIKSLEKPEITDYPRELNAGDVLIIRGRTYPNAQVTIHLQKDDLETSDAYLVPSDGSGNFTFIYGQKVEAGIYRFWAEVQTQNGAKSDSTDKFAIVVKQLIFNIIILIVILLILLLIIIILILYWWRKLILLKRSLRKVEESENALHKAFRVLKRDIEQQVDKLEGAESKRTLTDEERDITHALRNHLDVTDMAEQFLEKEIQDIEKKLYKDFNNDDGGK